MTSFSKVVLQSYTPTPASYGSVATPTYTLAVTTHPPTWTTLVLPGGTVPFWTPVTTIPTIKFVTYPAQAATPPSYSAPLGLQNFQVGWTGRTPSGLSIVTDGYMSFTIPVTNAGVVAGLSPAPQTNAYADIQFGIYSSNGVAQVYEYGVSVYTYGAHTSSNVFKIERQNNVVRYWVDSALIYTSTQGATPWQLNATAVLYAGGDSVQNVAVSAENGSVSTMSPLGAFCGSASYTGAVVSGSMLAFTGSAYQLVHVDCSMMGFALSSSGGETYQYAICTLPNMEGTATGLPTPPYGLATCAMDAMIGAAYGFGSNSGNVNAAMLPMTAYAGQGSVSSTQGVMLPMIGLSTSLEAPGYGTVFSGAASTAPLSGNSTVFAIVNSSGLLTGLVLVQGIVPGDITVSGTIGGAFSGQLTITALMTAIASMANVNFDDGSSTVWVVNTKNDGTTRYSNFGFNSFAKIGASYYGVMRNGLYKLHGATDAGAQIAAAVNLGNSDFGTTKEKALPNCYVGVSSSGAAVLKVVANGVTNYYTARNSSSVLETQRIDMGKGLRANYFELELQNTAGGAIEFESIEFTPIPLSRRI